RVALAAGLDVGLTRARLEPGGDLGVVEAGVVVGLGAVAVEAPGRVELARVADHGDVEVVGAAVDVGQPHAPLDDADLGAHADVAQVVLDHLTGLDVVLVRLRQGHVERDAAVPAGLVEQRAGRLDPKSGV